ncbi:ABC transporter ATP-binding protein [Nitrospinota bacterium]
MATLDITGLLKIFGTDVRAVDKIDLHIDHGELISLLGPSGCGKTTTLRLVAGLLDPEDGEIRVDGQVVSSPSFIISPERRNMSMIFQSYAIWPHKTVGQNVAYGLKFRSISRHEADQKVKKMLSIVRMDYLIDRYPGELSGGQQQRVALARALVVEPAILLLDEPLSNLDANLREEMRFEIRRLHDEFQITSIYVTHDQTEAMVTSDRICVMNRGKIEQVGNPTEIYESPQTRFVAEFVGVTNVIKGTVSGPGRFAAGSDLTLHMEEGKSAAAGQERYVSIRPHRVTILPEGAAVDGSDGRNVLDGEVVRASYFGSAVDHLVKVRGLEEPLRVVGDPAHFFPLGNKVRLAIERSAVVLVSGGED